MKKLTIKEFINKSKKIHGNKYDYSEVEYVNSQIKVKLKCHCGLIFFQKPNGHLNGHGCPKCRIKISRQQHKITFDEFLKRAVEKHKNKYDYSLTNYIERILKQKLYKVIVFLF